MAQCPYRNENERQCKLDLKPDGSPHDGQHKMAIRNRSLPKGVTLRRTQVSSKDVDTTSTRTAKAHEGLQLEVDKDVLASHQTWLKMGKPEVGDFFQSPTAEHFTYIVPPTAEDAALDMLRLATGAGTKLEGKSLRYRKYTHKSGDTAIRFVAVDPKPKEEKKEEAKK